MSNDRFTSVSLRIETKAQLAGEGKFNDSYDSMGTFDGLEPLLRQLYAHFQRLDYRGELYDEMMSDLEHVLSICALRRECSEINE